MNNFNVQILKFILESKELWYEEKGVLDLSMKKQVCVIPFTRDFLLEYNQMEPTPLEIIESVDMMKILENGGKVKMVPTNFVTKAVDTKEDLDLVCEMMKKDKIYKKDYKCQ